MKNSNNQSPTLKFDAASFYDEGYRAHVNGEGKQANKYPRDSAEWSAWNGGFEASESDYENDVD